MALRLLSAHSSRIPPKVLPQSRKHPNYGFPKLVYVFRGSHAARSFEEACRMILPTSWQLKTGHLIYEPRFRVLGFRVFGSLSIFYVLALYHNYSMECRKTLLKLIIQALV